MVKRSQGTIPGSPACTPDQQRANYTDQCDDGEKSNNPGADRARDIRATRHGTLGVCRGTLDLQVCSLQSPWWQLRCQCESPVLLKCKAQDKLLGVRSHGIGVVVFEKSDRRWRELAFSTQVDSLANHPDRLTGESCRST